MHFPTLFHPVGPCVQACASFSFFRLPPYLLLLLLQPFSFLLLPRWSPAAAFFSPPPRVAFCFQRTRCLATHSGRQVRLRNENERTRGEGSRGSLLKNQGPPHSLEGGISVTTPPHSLPFRRWRRRRDTSRKNGNFTAQKFFSHAA